MSKPFWLPLTTGALVAIAACGGGGDSTSPKNGELVVTISGVPSGPAAVIVKGPHGYQATVTQTATLSGLIAGSYSVIGAPVVVDSETYAPTLDTLAVSVTANTAPSEASVLYVLASGRLAVAISGLPVGATPSVFVSSSAPRVDTLHASRTINDLKPGKYFFGAASVARGDTTYATTFLYDSVIVPASLTPVSIAVVYAVATAQLRIVIDTIAGALAPSVTVSGPFNYSHTITKLDTTLLTGLPLGTYSLSGARVRNTTDEYEPYNLVYDVATFTGSFRFDSFEVKHFVSSAAAQVTFSGLPAGVNGSATVTGPSGFNRAFTSPTILHFLPPGQYVGTPDTVLAGGVWYYPAPRNWNQGCDASTTPCQLQFDYAPIDAYIAGMHLTQATQRLDGSVPLVAGRDALARVFPVLNRYYGRIMSVRVHWYQGGVLIRTDTMFNTPVNGYDPNGLQQGTSGSANLVLPGAMVQPGLSWVADVDPENVVAEANESNNTFPATGTPSPIDIRVTDSAHLTLVPVLVPVPGGLTGNMGNSPQYVSLARKIHPVPGFVLTIHPPYTTTAVAPLQPDDANGEWVQVITELAALRMADNVPASEMYYGVVHPTYTSGVAGLGYIGYPVAMGWDGSIREQVLAHEIGHNWGQTHAPCGSPANPDPTYPYFGGTIGVAGWDQSTGTILSPQTTYDIMSYCQPYWTSDYTWDSVMSFRASNGYDIVRARAAVEEPALLVWGHEVNGRLTIEPAFEVTTRAQLPDGRGAYSLEGLDESGDRLFSYAFSPHAIADGRANARSFVFAIPLSQFDASRLHELRVSGGERIASVRRASAMMPSLLKARRSGGGTALTWDAMAYPMAMVRDALTGKVLSFARRGAVTVRPSGGNVLVTLSDGVRSTVEIP